MPLIFRQTTIRGIAVAPRSSFERMNPFLDKHQIKPVIDQVYADVMFRTGRYLEKATLPSQMGFEASGTVLATGAGVDGVRDGDAVGVLPGFDISKYGT